MTAQPTPQGVTLLKELLFDRETKRLEEMSRKIEVQAQHALMRDTELSGRIDAVFERAGSEAKLQHSVAGIIDGALREAEVLKHEDLSRAIAPLIVRTIKFQLRESQDEMVDALYPITGRLVKSYVQSAINDMMLEINAKLGGGRPAKLAEQSAASGVSMGELALADANQLRVEELFLVRQGSGELVSHWERPAEDGSASAGTRPGGVDRDVLVSGYLSGIMSLSEEAFGAAPGSFRTLALENGERIFVRGSAAHLLAVRCSGSASAPVEQVIDEVFLETLERYQRVLAVDTVRRRPPRTNGAVPPPSQDDSVGEILPKVGQSIETLTAERQATLASQQMAAQAMAGPSFKRLYVIMSLVATPFIAWGLWSAYQSFQTMLTENAAQRVMAETEDIKGVPPKIDVKRGGRALTLSGFVPSEELRDKLLTRLAAEVPQATIRNQLGVLPAGSGPAEIAIAQLQQQLARAQLDNAVAAPVARATQRLGSVRETVGRLAAAPDTQARVPLQTAGRTLEDAAAALEKTRVVLIGATRPDATVTQPLALAWQKLTFAEAQLARIQGGPPPEERLLSQAPSDPGRLAEEVAMSTERLSTAQLGLSQTVAMLANKIDHIRTPHEAFDALVRSSAIFFDNGTDLRDPGLSGRVLDQLARSLRDNPAFVLRVVGFTDEKGTAAINTNLAQARASRVASLLGERGATASQLVAIGRQTAKDLSRASGPGNVNRRVEFEVGFPGEKGDQ